MVGGGVVVGRREEPDLEEQAEAHDAHENGEEPAEVGKLRSGEGSGEEESRERHESQPAEGPGVQEAGHARDQDGGRDQGEADQQREDGVEVGLPGGCPPRDRLRAEKGGGVGDKQGGQTKDHEVNYRR